METFVSEKGPLLSGALRSCVSRFDPDFDFVGAQHLELSRFAAYSSREATHVFLGFLSSVDLAQFVALAQRAGASQLYVYVGPGVLKNTSKEGLAAVLGSLRLQGDAFDLDVHVMQAHGESVVEVPYLSSLECIVQDDLAREAFATFPVAKELIGLLESAGCEVFFHDDVMIGTYLGLEVARSKGTGVDLHLEVGVGRNDRVARQWMGTDDTYGELLRAIESVKGFRLGTNRFHPLARLSTARWMRSVVSKLPSQISMEHLSATELRRSSTWPVEGIWSLAQPSEVGTDDDLIYRGSEASFEDDDVSFALASNAAGETFVLCFCSSVSLGSSVKTFEVTSSLIEHGTGVSGSILVMQEESRISAVERLVQLANFNLSIAVLPKSWKNLTPLGG